METKLPHTWRCSAPGVAEGATHLRSLPSPIRVGAFVFYSILGGSFNHGAGELAVSTNTCSHKTGTHTSANGNIGVYTCKEMYPHG